MLASKGVKRIDEVVSSLAGVDLGWVMAGIRDGFYMDGFVDELPVPYQNKASLGKVPPEGWRERRSAFTANRLPCPYCTRVTYLLFRVGFDLFLPICFFCAKDRDMDVGMDETAVVRLRKRAVGRLPNLGNFGRVQVGPFNPFNFRTTAATAPENEAAALYYRNLATSPKSTRAEWDPLIQFLKQNLNILFPHFQDHFRSWWTIEEWLSRATSSTVIKRDVKAAYDLFWNMGPAARFYMRKCKAKGFVKKDNDKVSYKARMIQSMEPLFTGYTACVISTIQEVVETILSSNIFFAAGKTQEELAPWFASIPGDYKIISLDMTNYDSTQRKGAIELELAFYSKIMKIYNFEFRHWMMEIFRRQKIDMKGGTKWYKYFVSYTKKSGAKDTCLGNSIQNYLSILWAVCRSAGVDPVVATRDHLVYMTLMGDDNLLAVPRGWDMSRLGRELEDLGYIPKQLAEDVFLNLRPVPTSEYGDSYVMSLLSGRILARLFSTMARLPSEKAAMGHLHGLMVNMLPQANHDPILQPLFLRLYELTDGIGFDQRAVEKSLNLKYKVLRRIKHPRTNFIDRNYCEYYSLSQEDLRSWEHFCSRLRVGSVLNHRVCHRCVSKDLEGMNGFCVLPTPKFRRGNFCYFPRLTALV